MSCKGMEKSERRREEMDGVKEREKKSVEGKKKIMEYNNAWEEGDGKRERKKDNKRE